MFIINKFFFNLHLSLHQKHQRKLLVCENLLGNKSHSDSEIIKHWAICIHSDIAIKESLFIVLDNLQSKVHGYSHRCRAPFYI